MNIGCDIVENKRLENKNDAFIDLILTKNEKLEYQKKGLLYLCGRFAAKEAIMKVLPNTKERNFESNASNKKLSFFRFWNLEYWRWYPILC